MQSSHLEESFFRDMEDTAWFEEKSDYEKLYHLSELMYSDEENAKKDFGTLLKLLPVDLVLQLLINILTFGALKLLFSIFGTYSSYSG